MAVVIDESSATMSAEYTGAHPGVTYTARGNVDMAVLHQGRNSGPIVSGKIRTPAQASAIKLRASIRVRADNPADVLRQYEFHLLQLAWKPIDYALYAGVTAADGSMKIDFTAPPLYPGDGALLLDAEESGNPPFPFVESSAATIVERGIHGPLVVSLEFNDHPNADRPLVFPNFAAGTGGKMNYLYQVERSLFFFTAFVIKDRSTNFIKPLGFIGWKSRLVAKIRWRRDADGNPSPDAAQLATAYFTADDYLPGTPNQNAKKMMVNPPTDPAETYNAIETANYKAVMGSTSNSSSLQASGTWPSSVPSTHFAR